MQAYESLAILEGTSSLAQQALQSGAKLKLEDTHNLNAYFNKVSWADTMPYCNLCVQHIVSQTDILWHLLLLMLSLQCRIAE